MKTKASNEAIIYDHLFIFMKNQIDKKKTLAL